MSEREEESVSPVSEAFMTQRTVVLTGEISHESVMEVGQRLLLLQIRSSDPINLIIDSGGGSTDAALQLCDIMSSVMTAPVRGIAIGSCGSAATFVMLHCSERVSTPYSRFLIHSGTMSQISILIGRPTAESVEQLLRDVRATEKLVLDLYMSRLTPVAWKETRPSDDDCLTYVQKLIDRGDQQYDAWMTAKEAVEVGLVTEIVREKLNIFKD